MRSIIPILILLAYTTAHALNTVEVTGPKGTILSHDQSPHSDDGNIWSGFTSGRWDVKFLSVSSGQVAAPPLKVDGRSGMLMPGWTHVSGPDAGRNMENFAQIITGDFNDLTLSTPYRAGTFRAASEYAVIVYEPGLTIPLYISYHPEPEAVASEAVIRVYINGGSFTVIGDGYRPVQHDLRISLTPPSYTSAEFALTALPTAPLTSPHAEVITDDPTQAKLTLSGTADTAHNGQRVYLRYRLVNLHRAQWSPLHPIAKVTAGTWSGSLPVPRDAEVELDLLMHGTDDTTYRQHVASTHLITLEDTIDGDYAYKAGDLVPNILKTASGIAPATRIGGSSNLTEVTPVTIGSDTYMAITYAVDPTQTTISVTPEWSPNYKGSPFRAGGVVRELLSTDGISGIQTWRARAPYPGDGYMRLNIKRISLNKITD